jgi:hypothetical protein
MKKTKSIKNSTAALAAAKRILKTAANIYIDKPLKYAPIIDGKQYLCDGFRLAELTEHLPLPSIPKDKISHYPDMQKIIKKSHDMVVLKLPTKTKLKAFIKISKANKINNDSQYTGVIYDFGFNYPQVNASYLLDMMELLPNMTAYCVPCKDKSGVNLNSIYLENHNSRGLLLPVRPDEKIPRAKTEL